MSEIAREAGELQSELLVLPGIWSYRRTVNLMEGGTGNTFKWMSQDETIS